MIANAIARADEDDIDAHEAAIFALIDTARNRTDPALEGWLHFLRRLFIAPIAALNERAMQTNPLWIDPRSITETQLAVMKRLGEIVERPSAKARLCDYIWLSTSDHTFARTAVAEYLRLGKDREDPENWIQPAEYYGRALRLSAKLGRGALFEEVVQAVAGLLRRLDGEDPLFLTTELMRALIDTRAGGDASFYASLAEKAARHAEAAAAADSSKFHLARIRWLMAAEWHRLRRDSAAETAARVAFAETYIAEAELAASMSPPRNGVAAGLYANGIHALRRLPSQRSRVSSLLARLKELQQSGVEELKPLTSVHDFSECIATARKHVAERSLGDSILALAGLLSIPSVDRLKAEVLERAQIFMAQRMFPTVLLNDQGAPIAGYGTLDPNSSDDDHPLKSRMFEDLRRARICDVFGFIEPARDEIVQRFVVPVQPFLELAARSEFVPPGRESIWAMGLHAGMLGDSLSAVHILVPQVEHSLRALLLRSGKVPVAWTKDGYEEAPDLNAILRDPEMEQLLGTDLLFTMTSLFVNRFGGNFRNRLAHGLVETDEFFSDTAIYTWWLLLKCVVTWSGNELGPNANA